MTSFSFLLLILLLISVHDTYGVAICHNTSSESLYATRSECDKNDLNYYSVEMNIFDSWWDYSGITGNKSETIKAITDFLNLNNSQFKIFRFFGYLWGESMEFYVNNETEFWLLYDEYYNYICSNSLFYNKIYLIPSLGYYTPKWWQLNNNNETINEFITNSSSKSRQLMYKYINKYITKYMNKKCILFWELGNELNLEVDLPNKPQNQSFNTSEMVLFINDIVTLIRNIDNIRPISSGYSCPRPNAYHLYYNKSWQIDNKQEWKYMLSLQNKPVDIISCHSYGNQPYFNESYQGVEQYYTAIQVTSNENKLFYLGEFGPNNVNYTSKNDTKFVYNTINSMIDIYNNTINSSWMLSTIWSWEDYSHGNTLLYPNRTSSIPVLNAMKDANIKMNSL